MEGNLELLAEKQVLNDEVLTAADGGDEGGQDEPEEFEHRGRIADPRSRRDRRTSFCRPTVARLGGRRRREQFAHPRHHTGAVELDAPQQ